MKLTTAVVTMMLVALVSGAAYAEGSKVDSSKINVSSQNSKTLGLAIGKNSSANTGSVTIKNSEVKGSEITNASKNSKTLGLAIGKNSSANTGSVDIK